MKITGPFFDRDKRGQPKPWYLRISAPRKHPDGTLVLVDGKPVLARRRPYYASKDDAAADKSALVAQYAMAGASASGGLLTREQASDYEQARAIVPEASAVDLARFWRLHHPLQSVLRVDACAELFSTAMLARLGKTAGYEDLRSRAGIFARDFGSRVPDSISRGEFLRWLDTKPTRPRFGRAPRPVSPRTILNLKQAVCRFYNWLRAQEPPLATTNPAAGIKREQLPKVLQKEIRFLALDYVTAYLRAAERYDPDLVAHEVVQLLAGVRADDEMAQFRGEWVMPETREVKIPAEISKKERRDVINTLEPIFWQWWQHYGRSGILRPGNYINRWRRVRILAAVTLRYGVARADELAGETAFSLQARPEFRPLLEQWPWNARRRTFCTYHVAKYQSADRTALILRHHGEAETLHNSYRGLGVTEVMGAAYFALEPAPVAAPVLCPVSTRPLRGIVKRQAERAA